jgi:hypothetical protein
MVAVEPGGGGTGDTFSCQAVSVQPPWDGFCDMLQQVVPPWDTADPLHTRRVPPFQSDLTRMTCADSDQPPTRSLRMWIGGKQPKN